MPDLYFEDFETGQTTTFGHKQVTAEEITAYAQLYDPQPFHLGEDTARDTFAGRLIASGWHTIGMEMRMICDAWLLRAAGMGSPGVEEVMWLRPVLPGATLSVRQTVLDSKASRSRPEMGVVRFRFEVLDGSGVVMSQINPIMFGRRGGEGQPDGPRTSATHRPAEATESLDTLLADRDDEPAIGRSFEAIRVGATDDLGEHTFGADEIVAFAAKFDPQPFHLDAEAASRGPFGQLAASGWHTASTWMRHLVRHRRTAADAARASGRIVPRFGPSPGFKDLRWLKPVVAGDSIRFATTVSGKRISASRPNWGLVFSRNTGWNQHGDKVFEFQGSGFMAVGER